MKYDTILDTIKKELEKEMDIREEIIYKKGFAAGYKEAEEKFKFDEDFVEDYGAEAYLEGLEDAREMILDIVHMSAEERDKIFGEHCLKKLLKTDSLNLFKTFITSLIDKENEEEEDPKAEFIGAILDADISDESKKMILALIDALGDKVEVVKL